MFPLTAQQRFWVHKTANVLNKLPKSVSAKAKADLHNSWMAETCKQAEKIFDHFTDKDGAKYDKAVACEQSIEIGGGDMIARHKHS